MTKQWLYRAALVFLVVLAILATDQRPLTSVSAQERKLKPHNGGTVSFTRCDHGMVLQSGIGDAAAAMLAEGCKQVTFDHVDINIWYAHGETLNVDNPPPCPTCPRDEQPDDDHAPPPAK